MLRNWVHLPACAVIALLVTGCGPSSTTFQVDKDLPALQEFLANRLSRPDTPSVISGASVKQITPVNNDLVRLEFTADFEQAQDTFIEIRGDNILAKAGWNTQSVADARKQLMQLPPADTSDLEKESPEAGLPARFVRRDGRMGDRRRYVGNCTVRPREGGWHFDHLTITDLGIKPADTSNDINDVRLLTVPPDAIDVDSSDGRDRIQAAVARQRKFIGDVESLTRAVVEREERQFEKLKEYSAGGRAWSVTAPNLSGQPVEWIVEFVACEQKDGPDAVRAVVRDPADELPRVVYQGKVNRTDIATPDRFTRPKRTPPTVTLICQGQSLIFIPPNAAQPVIRFDEKGEAIRFQVPTHDSAMTSRGDVGALSQNDTTLWNRLLDRIKPGTQWTGTVRTLHHGVIRLLFTITDSKPDGSYVRAVAETPDIPVTAIVYEGSCSKSDLHVAPLRMLASSGLRTPKMVAEFLNADQNMAAVPLTLTLNERGFRGRRGNDEVELVSSTVVKDGANRPAHTLEAFQAGAKYKGRLIGESDEDLGEIHLKVAEVRDSGEYLRVVVNAVETPYELVTYEGKIRTEAAYADGYCLELKKQTPGWRLPLMLNRDTTPVTLAIRLTCAEDHCICAVQMDRARVAEWVALTRVPTEPNPRSLATAEAAPAIRAKLATGSAWRGQYKSSLQSKSADVSMRVIRLSGDGITVEFLSTQLQGARVVYEGLLRLEDPFVNGTFAVLQKSVGGKAPVGRPLGSAVSRTIVPLFDP